MTGYISNNNIHCKTPIYIKLLHTTTDNFHHIIDDKNNYKCKDTYQMFIESTNVFEGYLQQQSYTFTMLISSKISINHTIVEVFDKSYEIYIKLFDMDDYECSFVINTCDKILIADNIYKLTYTFTNNQYNCTQLMCNIKGYINDSFVLSICDKLTYDDYIINVNIK
jgi:hypothetical protein